VKRGMVGVRDGLKECVGALDGLETCELYGFEGNASFLKCVAWNCDGQLLAAGDSSGLTRFYDASDDEFGIAGTLMLNNDIVFLEWNPKDPLVIAFATAPVEFVRIVTLLELPRTAVPSRSAVMRRAVPPEVQHTERTLSTAGHSAGDNLNLTWSPDGIFLAVTTQRNFVFIFDTSNNNDSIKIVEKVDDEVNEVRWSPDGKVFIMSHGSGKFSLWSWPEWIMCWNPQAHTDRIWTVAFGPQRQSPSMKEDHSTKDSRIAQKFALGSKDTLISVWNYEGFYCQNSTSITSTPVRLLSFSHDGTLLAVGSENLFIDVVHVPSMQVAKKIRFSQLSAPNAFANSLAWHPSKVMLAFSREDSNSVFLLGADIRVGAKNVPNLGARPSMSGLVPTPRSAAASRKAEIWNISE